MIYNRHVIVNCEMTRSGSHDHARADKPHSGGGHPLKFAGGGYEPTCGIGAPKGMNGCGAIIGGGCGIIGARGVIIGDRCEIIGVGIGESIRADIGAVSTVGGGGAPCNDVIVVEDSDLMIGC